ncbi:MAG: hypothetical protein EA398_18335 [Deltaproteobacteria bacterium]|nr:MAG: hypothetical protein EA398_18335 [Deltaproteobacteria bacterium]
MKPVPLMAHDASVRRLERVWRILEDHGVEPWLDQGSLLGVVRDGRLIPWDNDIDISCWRTQWDRNETAILRALEEARFHYTVRKRGLSLQPEGATMFIDLSFKHVEGNRVLGEFGTPPRSAMEGYLRRLAYKSRFLRGALGSPGAVESTPARRMLSRLAPRMVPRKVALMIERALFQISGNTVEQRIPAHFLERFTPIAWSGHDWRAPADVDGYLAFKYGPDWRKPRREYVYYLEDGAIARPPGAPPTDPTA